MHMGEEMDCYYKWLDDVDNLASAGRAMRSLLAITASYC